MVGHPFQILGFDLLLLSDGASGDCNDDAAAAASSGGNGGRSGSGDEQEHQKGLLQLLEVNAFPDFTMHCTVDREVKEAVLSAAMRQIKQLFHDNASRQAQPKMPAPASVGRCVCERKEALELG
jgi:hypothetical protein